MVQYRREIDGLRALAVLPVIFFHAGFSIFRGGFVGVDIFFVISGYLITSIIARELEEGRFSIVRFYERRARRILPALYLVLACSMAAAWFRFLATDFRDFMACVTAVTLFVSNFYFLEHIDYFSIDAEVNPLIHTWTLAVEEQYYIFFPLLLMAVWRFGRRFAILTLAAIFVASLVYAQWASHASAKLAYYMLVTRAWELLIGSAAALYLGKRGHLQSRMLNELGAVAGVVLIVGSLLFITQWKPYPSIYTLPPTVGTFLIIFCAVPGTWVNRVLSWRAFVGIGLISYSAYLWHQPLFAFARYGNYPAPSGATMFALGLAVFPLAWLSWRFVEAPFRNHRLVSRRQVFALSAIVGVLLGAAGVAGYRSGGVPERAAVQKWKLLDYQPDNRYLDNLYWQALRARSGSSSYGVFNNPYDRTLWFTPSDKLKVLVLGNSHSKDLYNVLAASAKFSQRAEVARYGIQIGALSPKFLAAPNYRAADVVIIESLYGNNELLKLDWFVDRVRQDGKKLVLMRKVHDFPYEGGTTLADHIVQTAVARGERDGRAIADAVNRAYYEDYAHGPDRTDAALANKQIADIQRRHPEVIVLDRMDFVCDAKTRRCTMIDERLNKFMFDNSHYSDAGDRFYGRTLDRSDWLDAILR